MSSGATSWNRLRAFIFSIDWVCQGFFLWGVFIGWILKNDNLDFSPQNWLFLSIPKAQVVTCGTVTQKPQALSEFRPAPKGRRS